MSKPTKKDIEAQAERYRQGLEDIKTDLAKFQDPDAKDCNSIWFISRVQWHTARALA